MAGLLRVAGESLGRGPGQSGGQTWGDGVGRGGGTVDVVVEGKAQRRHLVADASKLRRTEGDSLFPLAKISWAQLPASLRKG